MRQPTAAELKKVTLLKRKAQQAAQAADLAITEITLECDAPAGAVLAMNEKGEPFWANAKGAPVELEAGGQAANE